MTNQEDKNKLEIWHFERFKELYEDQFGEFPDGHTVKSESPDILVTCPDGQIIGIEHTGIYNKHRKVKVEEDFLKMVNRKLLAIYQNQPVPYVYFLSFTDDNTLDQEKVKQRESIADEVVGLIVDNPHKKIIDQNNMIELPACIDNIRKRDIDEPKKNMVSQLGAFYTPVITVEFLQTEIDRKSGKVKQYKEKCNFTWLLITAHADAKSTVFHIHREQLKYTYSTLFDRVFLQLDHNNLYELSVSRVK